MLGFFESRLNLKVIDVSCGLGKGGGGGQGEREGLRKLSLVLWVVNSNCPKADTLTVHLFLFTVWGRKHPKKRQHLSRALLGPGIGPTGDFIQFPIPPTPLPLPSPLPPRQIVRRITILQCYSLSTLYIHYCIICIYVDIIILFCIAST